MFEAVTGALGVELTSVVIGGLGGVTTYGFLNWNERRIRRDRFRRSLAFEIDHVGRSLEDLSAALEGAETPPDDQELHAALATDLLDAEFRAIGKLTTSEISHVYRFYEATAVVRGTVDEDGLASVTRDRIDAALKARDDALGAIKRSRLSRATERFKDIEARR